MFDIPEFSAETVKLKLHLEQWDWTSSQLNNGLCLELSVWRKEVSLHVLLVLGCRRLTPRVEHISHTPGLFMSLLEITPIS